jgi:hypothetical protein
MSTQHTPGPWEAVYVGSGDWDLRGPVTREDWKLAVAAPDLLDALETMLAQFTKTPSTLKDTEARAKAHAAIDKATGEQA